MVDVPIHSSNMEKQRRTGYSSNVSDEDCAFVAPYLTLCKEDAGQRHYPCGPFSTQCVTWCAVALRGACFPMNCRRGGWSISRYGVRWMRVVS